MGRTRLLNNLPGNLEAQFRYGMASLHRVSPPPGRSCELWACDYYGNLRFFRLEGTGVTEIDMNGRAAGHVPDGSEIPQPPPDEGKVTG